MWSSMGKLSRNDFFQNTCRIFCAKGITVSQIFCELSHFEMLVLDNLEKSDFYIFLKIELYWNTINFNDITCRCNFKALLNIFLHFRMDKMSQRGILMSFFYFSPFSLFSPNFACRLWPGFPIDGHICLVFVSSVVLGLIFWYKHKICLAQIWGEGDARYCSDRTSSWHRNPWLWESNETL
jgi:hypothetical protein